MRSCIDAVPSAECTLEDWIAAGEAASILRRQGTAVPLTDLLIAVVAKRLGAGIYTTDRHFRVIAGNKDLGLAGMAETGID